MRLLLILLFFIFSLLFSCSSNTEPKKLENKLYIKIKDKDGNPIKGVGLHFFYNPGIGENSINKSSSLIKNYTLSDYKLYQNYPNPFNPNTRIAISLPESGQVSLLILDRLDSTKIIKTLKNDFLKAGLYNFLWDGTNDEGKYVTNNIYNYQLITNKFRETKNLFLNMINPEYIKSLNCIPLSTSDSKGNMEVEYTIFPINLETVWTDEQGNELGVLSIPNTINLVFLKDGYLSATKKVTINLDEPMNLTVVLYKE